jgi:hypothetical protein
VAMLRRRRTPAPSLASSGSTTSTTARSSMPGD